MSLDFLLHPSWCARVLLTMGHFVWQGLVIALLASLAMYALRRAASRLRYGVLASAMFAMAFCPVMTILVCEVPQQNPLAMEKPAATELPERSSWTVADQAAFVQSDSSGAKRAGNFADTVSAVPAADSALSLNGLRTFLVRQGPRLAPIATAIYGAVVTILLCRLILGLHGGRRLCRKSQPVADGIIPQILEQQARLLKLRVVPAVAWSLHVTVPVVVGLCRPTILLPLSLATGLSPEQVATILAHELAHIRRYDHWVNIFQRIIESFLFFHPAVWWLSHRIRVEREHCCDDTVVSLGVPALTYAESLLRVAEMGRSHAGSETLLGTAGLYATARPSRLRQRIARLLGNPGDTRVRLGDAWTLPLAAGLVFMISTPVVLALRTEPVPTPNPQTISQELLSPPIPEKPGINIVLADGRNPDMKFESAMTLGEDRQSVTVPDSFTLPFAKVRHVTIRPTHRDGPMKVSVEFFCLGEVDSQRRILVDVRSLDKDRRLAHHTWLVAGDGRYHAEIAETTTDRFRASRVNQENFQIPHYCVPRVQTIEIRLKQMTPEELRNFPPTPSRTQLTMSKPDAAGRFSISFENPSSEYRADGWNLDPDKHQIIFQVAIRDVDGALREKIFRQLGIKREGRYRVEVQVPPHLIDHSSVGITFVTIQPNHDEWVRAFFHEGKGTTYSGLWTGDGGKLNEIAIEGESPVDSEVKDLGDATATPFPGHSNEPNRAEARGDDWGDAKDGLRTRLVLLTERPVVGGPLKFRLELQNTSDTVRYYDPQYIAPFRVVGVTKADGTPEPYAGLTYQTLGESKPIQAGETVVVWDDFDAAEYFLLADPGSYVAQSRGAKPVAPPLPAGAQEPKLAPIPPSNRVTLQLSAGKLPESKAAFVRMRKILPQEKAWRISMSDAVIFFTHSPTNLKKDVTAIQLWFTKEMLPPDFKLGSGDSEQVVEYLGQTPLGFANLAAPARAKQLWPEYTAQIRNALHGDGETRAAPVQVLKRDGDKVLQAQIIAKTEGREREEVLRRWYESLQLRGVDPDSIRAGSFTDQETIVSTKSPRQDGQKLVAREFLFNLPEGSELRAEFTGSSLRLHQATDKTHIEIENGTLRLVDPDGVARATAKSTYTPNHLHIEAWVNGHGEIVMHARGSGPHVAPPVEVVLDPATGRPTDEKQPPHGAVRYQLFMRGESDERPTQFKMQWMYDIEMLRKESKRLEDSNVKTKKSAPHLPQAPATNLSITAKVLDPDGRPATRISASIWKTAAPEDHSHNDSCWHDPEGRIWQVVRGAATSESYTESNLEHGVYRVAVRGGHHNATPVAVSEPFELNGREQHTTVTVRLQSGRSLEIRAIASDTGEPLTKPEVIVVNTDGRLPPNWRFTPAPSKGNGPHEITDLPVGKYSITAYQRAQRPHDMEYSLEPDPLHVEIPDDQDRQVTLRLRGKPLTDQAISSRWPWIVQGRVTDGKGKPVADAEIRAHCGIGTLHVTGSAQSDADGHYQMRFGPGIRMGPGNAAQLQAATISVHKDDYFEKNLHRQGDRLAAYTLGDVKFPVWGKNDKDAVFLPGEPKAIDFVLLPAARASGVLMDGDGNPLADYRVSLTGDVLPPSSSALASGGRTDHDGRFQFRSIPTGYQFQILIEPPKAEPPWLAWASSPLEFLQPGQRDIVAVAHEAGRTVELSAERFELSLVGPGVSWRKALKQGLSPDSLEVQVDNLRAVRSNEKSSRLQAATLRLVLGSKE